MKAQALEVLRRLGELILWKWLLEHRARDTVSHGGPSRAVFE